MCLRKKVFWRKEPLRAKRRRLEASRLFREWRERSGQWGVGVGETEREGTRMGGEGPLGPSSCGQRYRLGSATASGRQVF